MKKLVLYLGYALLVVLPLTAQVIVWEENFEDHGNSTNGGAGRYTSNNDFHGGSNDYFGRVEGTTQEYFLTNVTSTQQINSEVTYTNWSGDFFYAAEDLNDVGGTIGDPDGVDFKDLIVTNIDISSAFGLLFRGLFAAGENGPCGNSVYDEADFVEVYYEVDGGGEVLGMCFNSDLECNIPNDITNEPLYFDNFLSQGGACDGDGGGGTLLTADFAEFFFLIPDGNNLDLRIRVRMDAGSEEFAFDKFEVEAETLGINDDKMHDDVSVVPNPSIGKFEIINPRALPLSKAEIYTADGKLVSSIDLRKMTYNKEIDLNGISNGLYIMKIVSVEGNTMIKRIIIK